MVVLSEKKAISLVRNKNRARILNSIHRAQARGNEAQSPAELAARLGLRVNLVAYHFRKLSSAGVLVLVGERQVRGSTEHFYRALFNITLKPAPNSPYETVFDGGRAYKRKELKAVIEKV